MNLSKGCFFFIVLFTGSVAQESCPTRNVTATCTGKSCADTRTCRKVGKTCQCVDNCGWTCVRIGCEFFGAPENGNVIYDPVNRTVGSTATFSCSPGYVLSGNAHLECLETKEWNATNDVSCAVQCPPLVAPENVHKDSSGTGYNERVEFSCDQGFSLNGESVLTCQSDGTWSADIPVCTAKSCGYPGDINNGGIIEGVYTYPNSVTYVCDEGFTINGRTTRTCQATQDWSGIAPSCNPVQCPALDTPVNGRKDGSGTGYNDRVEFSCDQGFSLHGESVLTCQGDGTWSSDVPECTGSCDSTDLPYGDVNEDERTVQVIPLRELVGTLTRNGGYIRVKCPEGYEHRGSRYMKCQEGEWMPYRRPSLPGRPPLCINV